MISGTWNFFYQGIGLLQYSTINFYYFSKHLVCLLLKEIIWVVTYSECYFLCSLQLNSYFIMINYIGLRPKAPSSAKRLLVPSKKMNLWTQPNTIYFILNCTEHFHLETEKHNKNKQILFSEWCKK